ncbi:MAG: N-acyl-D-amino-acid deacylase, partial [Caulobacteraceae bacterium]|nr:N-acyl-D-amino-acid deacylase [Caulobacteraceae bacterium]
DTYAPKADYIHPRVLSAGVVELFVNGQAAVDDGKITGALPGRAIKHMPTAGSCS